MLTHKLGKHFLSQNNLLLLGAFLFLFLAGIVHEQSPKPELNISKQESAINVDKNLLLYISMGNKRLLADLIWIQTLLESDLEHYKKRDLNNWLFLRFTTIQQLDPFFYENYLYGGQFLSIIKDDLAGAELLYQSSTDFYPDDYHLNFHAGFMNYFEKGDLPRALYYLQKIEGHPKAPHYLSSIINKLKYGISHDLKSAFELVRLNYESTQDPYIKKRLASDLYAIRAEIDLECLNLKKLSCDRTDIEGNSYILQNGKYVAPRVFTPYGIKIRNSN